MKQYTITRTRSDVPLSDAVDGAPWEEAAAIHIDEFSWHESGPKPLTTGRVLYDDEAIYLQFFVEDDDITASVTELNGPTFEDSSVEFFADPTPDEDSLYLNFEPNCCGQFKLAWQEAGWQERGIGRDLISPDLASRISIRTSVTGSTADGDADDDGWWLAAAIPFDVLSTLTGREIAPTAGTEWRGNFYRSGVASDSQKATWNLIEKPEPDYHSPTYFGRLPFE
ncbi:carbohydrate-binding family 9-like protein [Natrinema sp. SYSU A 869]|uniref:carbohydrate-binding family 9-like protein n=1 Tax=Natrinema sp. SYSU A 869 TaxID=2871694 RepID=UPI001CA3C117|nr:carbohydrate-binding family 9-like protein [Natrinema sp. SYSU A 869]